MAKYFGGTCVNPPHIHGLAKTAGLRIRIYFMETSRLPGSYTRIRSELSSPHLMKNLFLIVCAMGTLCEFASCTGDLYSRTVPAVTTSTSAAVSPPEFGSPTYESGLRPYGRPYERSGFYPYSASHPGGMGYYDRVASPHGSYEYIYHDMEVPHPAPGTPLKEKTVRYTSRHPSAWGSPVWVTTIKPRLFARRGNGATTATTAASGSGSE